MSKEAIIVRTIHPSRGYSVHVETWDERGHDNTGWRHRDLLSAPGATAVVEAERHYYQVHGYDVEVTDSEVSLA